jgi:ATP-dependent RNA helicase DDX23/PRP28
MRRVRERRPDSHMEREQDRDREKIAEREREKELEAIKEQYLGSKKPKKRVIKPSEKFRFSFDWENTEDTSRDMNTLYQSPHEARLLFGRGFLAGVDRREQKVVAAQHEKEIRAELRRKAGAGESLEEQLLQQIRMMPLTCVWTGTGLRSRQRR